MASNFKAGVNPFEVPNTLFGNKSTDKNVEDSGSDSQSTLSISKLKPFSKHPFKPYTGDKLQSLSDSIKDNGLYCPILVRPIEDKNYEYEIIAGHNRVQASKLAGYEEIPCISKDMTDDEATIAMADTNLQQREEMLPSEKAFAYKYKLDAMKSQGKRNDLTCAQLGHKLESKKSIEKLSEDSEDSRNQIKRYIRLTHLITPLLDEVDSSKLKFIPAVNLSYLKVEEQKSLLDILNREENFGVSKVQSERLKEMSNTKALTFDDIDTLITQKISNTVSAFKTPYSKVQQYFPKTVTPKEFNDTVKKALEFYFEHNQDLDKDIVEADDLDLAQ